MNANVVNKLVEYGNLRIRMAIPLAQAERDGNTDYCKKHQPAFDRINQKLIELKKKATSEEITQAELIGPPLNILRNNVMRIKCLFIQRNERYQGEYAPELLVAVDEFIDDDNPQWFKDECAKELAEAQKEGIQGHAIVELEIDQSALRELLIGPKTLPTKIVWEDAKRGT